MMTRWTLLNHEAITLASLVGLGAADAILFFSASRSCPSGRTAFISEVRWHFLARPCIEKSAIGRMVACTDPTSPDTVIHHQEGRCPYRLYTGLNEP